MSILSKVRLAAGIVLLCAIFLPLSECSRSDNRLAQPAAATFSQRVFPQNNSEFEYQYVVGMLRWSSWQAGAVAFIALAWPMAAFLFDRRVVGKRFGWAIYVLELILCYATIYWLCFFTALGRWLYGAYVVVTAAGIFGVATVVLLALSIRRLIRARRAEKRSNPAL